MEVGIEKMKDPVHILPGIKTSQKDSIKDSLEKNCFDVSSGLICFGLLPQEVDEVTRME